VPGLKWSKHQSGKFEAEETKMIRSGNRYLRYLGVDGSKISDFLNFSS
jgi:hypothetical protein